ncbi:MAG: hypothetical protein H0Z39_04950 [Peptococcaceae bacterium]|nr:hypothetical protein [Peptococcaceae bacterium]
MDTKEFSPEEQEFIKELNAAGMPEDLADWLDQEGPVPPAGSLNRIKERTMSRSSCKKRMPFWYAFSIRVAAAVLILAVVFTIAAGPQKVVAGIEGLLRYVPGFTAGISVEDGEEPGFLAAASPLVVESGKKRLEILGLCGNNEKTDLHIRATNVWRIDARFEKPYLIDEDGAKLLTKSSHTYSGGNGPVEGWFRFAPLPQDTSYVQLVIPGHEELTTRIYLVKGDSLAGLDEVGISASAQGITITAVPELRDTELVTNLVFQLDHPKSKVVSVGDYPRQKTLPVLKDDTGKVYELLENNTQNLRFAAVDAASDVLNLAIPALVIEEPGEARVKLPIPEEGASHVLNKSVSLGRSTFTITKVQTLNGRVLQVNVDLGKPTLRTLIGFKVDPVSDHPSWGWMAKLDQQTGQILYFKIYPDNLSEGNEVELIFKKPTVQVDGPWTFEIDRAQITNTVYRAAVSQEEARGRTWEEIGKSLFKQHLERFQAPEFADQARLEAYRINTVQVTELKENGFVFTVDFDVKPTVPHTYWTAGNGRMEGDWIKGKVQFVTVVKTQDSYYISGMGTGP